MISIPQTRAEIDAYFDTVGFTARDETRTSILDGFEQLSTEHRNTLLGRMARLRKVDLDKLINTLRADVFQDPDGSAFSKPATLMAWVAREFRGVASPEWLKIARAPHDYPELMAKLTEAITEAVTYGARYSETAPPEQQKTLVPAMRQAVLAHMAKLDPDLMGEILERCATWPLWQRAEIATIFAYWETGERGLVVPTYDRMDEVAKFLREELKRPAVLLAYEDAVRWTPVGSFPLNKNAANEHRGVRCAAALLRARATGANITKLWHAIDVLEAATVSQGSADAALRELARRGKPELSMRAELALLVRGKPSSFEACYADWSTDAVRAMQAIKRVYERGDRLPASPKVTQLVDRLRTDFAAGADVDHYVARWLGWEGDHLPLLTAIDELRLAGPKLTAAVERYELLSRSNAALSALDAAIEHLLAVGTVDSIPAPPAKQKNMRFSVRQHVLIHARNLEPAQLAALLHRFETGPVQDSAQLISRLARVEPAGMRFTTKNPAEIDAILRAAIQS